MTVLGYGAWFYILSKYTMPIAMPFLLLIPVTAILGAVIFLKEYPVISITELKIGDLGSETVQTLSDFDVYTWGIDGIFATTQGTSALVTYTAGMGASEQQQLEALMLRVTAREMSQILADAQGLQRLKAEGVDMTFANAGASGFSDEDLRWVRRYRRRGVY